MQCKVDFSNGLQCCLTRKYGILSLKYSSTNTHIDIFEIKIKRAG